GAGRRALVSALADQSGLQYRRPAGRVGGGADRLSPLPRPRRATLETGRGRGGGQRPVAGAQLPQLCGLCAGRDLRGGVRGPASAGRRAARGADVRRGGVVALSSARHHRLAVVRRRGGGAPDGAWPDRRRQADAGGGTNGGGQGGLSGGVRPLFDGGAVGAEAFGVEVERAF